MFERDPTLAFRLEQFIHQFRADFRRREQAEWAAVYLQGLLRMGGRKTIENLARRVTLPDRLQVEDVSQALQHFINQSPWDEQKIYRRYHGWLAERFGEPGGLFVLDELVFVKQGRHSVGVQRQYSAALGFKANCQTAIALYYLSPDEFLPLSLRLYLPRHWLEDGARLHAAGVPETALRSPNKNMLALELLENARAAGLGGAEVTLACAWSRRDELAESVRDCGLSIREELPSSIVENLMNGRKEFQLELGLDHFEGRSWRGFHHHTCLVVLAYALLSLRAKEGICVK
jgi:SRSO17 transposase